MTQLPMKFEPEFRELEMPTPAKERHKREDPVTSVLSAKAIAGELPGLRAWVARCVRARPGRTGYELAREFSRDDHERLRRRLNEVEKEGVIRRGGKRRCIVTGRQAFVWYPVSSGQAAGGAVV